MNNNYNSKNNNNSSAKRQNPRLDSSNINENQPCLPQEQHHFPQYQHNQYQHSANITNKPQYSHQVPQQQQQQQQMQIQQPTNQYQTAQVIQNVEHANHNAKSIFSKIIDHLKGNLILTLTITGILLGIGLGFVGRLYSPSQSTLILISFPGEILLRLLKMLILPLIISSLITGLAQLDPKSSGKMGTRALGFYVATTFVATVTGICMALIIRPGRHKKERTDADNIKKSNSDPISTTDAILDIIRNMFPENIVQACSKQIQTIYKTTTIKTHNYINLTNGTAIIANVTETTKITRELKYVDGTNVMGLVVFCIIFGIFISHSKSEAQILYDFFYVMNELIMKIVALIMWYSPFGILCLVAGNIIKIENMAETARRLSIYMITVIIGLIIHAMITIQTMYFLTTRKNPFKFLKGMLQAWLTAVGTASSSATLPITFRCLEENNKVDKRITRFMLPLGATINMDGTALYQCVATIFIAQLNGISLTFGQLIAISLASTATSIGVASIPSAALVTMLIVLSTVGLPTEDISYIVTVDWLLDRLRTSINVLGDAYGCGIVEHLSREELKKLDEEAEQEFTKIISTNTNLVGDTCDVDIDNKISPSSPNMANSKGDKFSDYNRFDSAYGNSQVQTQTQTQQAQSRISIEQDYQKQQLQPHPPSIVVMDAVRRRSRVLLFNSKLPTSVYSMPQISQYANNSINEDSNV